MTTNETFSGTLNDSNTNETLTADELELTEAEYDALVEESIDCSQAEGHVRAPNGRRVYAA
jgi:hypothetical protein